MRLMKDLGHRMLEGLGVRAFRLATLPCGADEIQDVIRLSSCPIRVVFDIGANVGRQSLRYVRGFKSAKIYAFEPFAETFAQLKANTAGEPRIEATQCAMGACRGTHQAGRISGPSGWNSLQAGLNDQIAAGSELLKVNTVDQFCMDRGIEFIDYLKTDTEGFDIEVLKGASEMLKQQRIRLILSECAFDRNDRRHSNFFDLFDLLIQNRYRFLGLCETIHSVHGSRAIDFSNALFGCEADARE